MEIRAGFGRIQREIRVASGHDTTMPTLPGFLLRIYYEQSFSMQNKTYPKQNILIDNYTRSCLASKYRVEDLPSALVPSSFLSKILDQLELGELLSDLTLQQLQKKGLIALLRYAKGELWLSEYDVIAHQEQLDRRQTAAAKIAKENAEKKLKETEQERKLEFSYAGVQTRVDTPRHKFESDPRSIAKFNQSKLRKKYDLDEYIEKSHFPKLMDILHRVDSGQRLSEDDLLWLKTDGGDYYTQKLREKYHSNEAEFYVKDFRANKNPWSAVNASSNYRKCNKSSEADELLNSLNVDGSKNLHLKSAVLTTHGGVRRDLGDRDTALKLGDQAHKLTPKDLRPCTLLGAVNMEIGNYALGQSWYEKAVERGASEKFVDSDIRKIILLAENSKQIEMCRHLLESDPERYFWAKKILNQKTPHRH